MSRFSAQIALGLTALLFVVCSSAAAADQNPTPVVAQTGPLVLAPISSAIVFSPDVKITTVNNDTAVLAGAYAGKLVEKTVLVGFGGYWLTTRDSAHMFYAGLVLGGRLIGTDSFNVSARGLAGAGYATLYQVVDAGGVYSFHRHDRFPVEPPHPVRFGATDYFWVFDPELRLAVRISGLVSLDVGGGYRLTTADDGFNDLTRGLTGSVGIRFNMGQ